MRAHAPKSKHQFPLGQVLSRRLVSYATAATAAGAGLFALAQPAEAHVVFTPTHVLIGPRSNYMLDLTNDVTTDFVIHGLVTANSSTVFSRFFIKPSPPNAMEGATHLGSSTANALKAGAVIGSSQRFVKGGQQGALMGEIINSPGGGQYRGQWTNVFNRYLGLKFQINGETHFGWARLSVKFSFFKPETAVITGYAYETDPNTPIMAGQEQGEAGDGIVPEPETGEDGSPGAWSTTPQTLQPASLGILALGAPGLSAWRPVRAARS